MWLLLLRSDILKIVLRIVLRTVVRFLSTFMCLTCPNLAPNTDGHSDLTGSSGGPYLDINDYLVHPPCASSAVGCFCPGLSLCLIWPASCSEPTTFARVSWGLRWWLGPLDRGSGRSMTPSLAQLGTKLVQLGGFRGSNLGPSCAKLVLSWAQMGPRLDF